jgi:hypothetical protein
MINLVYWTTVFFMRAFYWDGKFIGKENLPRDEASIFVCNHLETDGPIGCCCTFPFEFHSWLIADMVDPALAEDYLRVDFVERSLHLRPPVSFRVAFYPVGVHESKQVRVGKPVFFSPLNAPKVERLRIRDYLEAAVKALYLESAQGMLVESPLAKA